MKKFCIFLLIAAMLTQLAACGAYNPSDQTELGTEASTESLETTRIQHQLPDELDFDGASFHAAFVSNIPDYYYAEESSADNMSAAVYRRTAKTEEFLGVDITYQEDVASEDFTTLYKAGDDVYQQLFLDTATHSLAYTISGYLYNLEALPYLDLTAEWWNLEQMKVLQLGKYPYFAVSDFMITSPNALLFNRDMISDNNLEDPYELVINGTWTLDKLFEMACAVRNDIDGDGVYESEDDIIGGNLDVLAAVALLTGCDQLISEKNEEGKLELILNSEKTIAIGDKLRAFVENKGSNEPASTSAGYRHFSTGTVLFTDGRPESMANVFDYDFDTGIVPVPKFDEAQENYMCYDWSGLMAVSNAVKNPEMVGAVIEFLSWDAKNEVFPTYYDVLLKTRYSSDMETRHMMDIIFDSVAYEIGGTYFSMQPGFCELWYTGPNFMIWGMDNFAAHFRAYKGAAKSTIANYYAEIEKFEGPMEVETSAESAN